MNLILVIEHGNKIRLHHQDLFTSSNISVITVHDANTALEVAKNQHPDLIICDILNPELNCYQILQETQKDTETIKIPWIFINSQTLDDNLDSSIQIADDQENKKIFPALAQLQAIISSLQISTVSTENNQIEEVQRKTHKNLEIENEFEQLKARFITMTSHEFRTPLTVIASSAGILKDFGHKLDDEKKRKHLDSIQTYVKHTTQLLDKILLINKAQTGNLAFEPCPLDIIPFCQKLMEEIQLSAANNQIIFSSNSLGSIIGNFDKKLLRQILINLLSNGIKYSPENATVNFNVNIIEQQAIFSIQDQGIGIPEEDQVKIFQSFHRATNVGSIPGTGLGLSIVAKCVDLHKGTIIVNSQVGIGTTFIVKIPIS